MFKKEGDVDKKENVGISPSYLIYYRPTYLLEFCLLCVSAWLDSFALETVTKDDRI